jgi:hypothetical protein
MRQNSTLSIIGLVVGIISLLISFIPCIGAFGAIPGIVGLILAYLGYRECQSEGISTSVAIIALILSGLAIVLGAGQWLFISKASSGVMEAANVTYENCDELLADWEKTTAQLEEVSKQAEKQGGFSAVKEIINISTRIGVIKSKSKEMECSNDSLFNTKFEEIANRLENVEHSQ